MDIENIPPPRVSVPTTCARRRRAILKDTFVRKKVFLISKTLQTNKRQAMPDSSKKFHEFALKSILFKGRPDWYFCYLKAEKIAHVLWIVAGQGGEGRVGSLAARAAELPGSVGYLAAGEADAAAVLADIFALMSEVRLAATEQIFSKEASTLLCKEYEEVAQRLVAGSHPSPFLTADDFRVTSLPEIEAPTHALPSIKDTTARKMSFMMSDSMSHRKPVSERMTLILDFIRKHKRSSIKEIAGAVKGCSEKTIQRELGALIEQGLIKKEGERRWSVYIPA
jgi:predicted transcriptional regulator